MPTNRHNFSRCKCLARVHKVFYFDNYLYMQKIPFLRRIERCNPEGLENKDTQNDIRS